MNNITFDELWEILFALEDKVEQIEKDIDLCVSVGNHESELKDFTEKKEYLKKLINKIEYKLNNGEA